MIQIDRVRTAITPIAVVLAAISCEAPPDASPVPQFQIEDSAGVVIVENPRPEAGSRLGWRVSVEPTLSIGTVEGSEDFQLHRVDDALMLPDGRIVVANAGSYQLLVFDPSGRLPGGVGTAGTGPRGLRRCRRCLGKRRTGHQPVLDRALAG